ncbi:hypothetical protein HKBW3S42_01757, partial [Candidatus Hakubella thermalkaliphila]
MQRGLEQREMSELQYIGIDEKNFLKGHKYVMVVSDLDHVRVLD